MKRIFLTTLALLLGFLTEAQLPSNARLIAGLPDYYFNFVMEDWLYYSDNVLRPYYISDVLKPQGDSLVTAIRLCDSMEYLQNIYYYPYFHKIIVFAFPKKSAYNNEDVIDVPYAKLITINTKTSDTLVNILEAKKKNEEVYNGISFNRILLFNNLIKYSISYMSDDYKFLAYMLTPETGEEDTIPKNLFPDHICIGGSSICVYCNYSNDYLHIPNHNNKLYFGEQNITSFINPPGLQNLYNAGILVNNPRVMLVSSYKNGSIILRIQDKKLHKWNELSLPVDTSLLNQNIYNRFFFKNFGDWLAGRRGDPQDAPEDYKYIGEELWNDTIKIPYSPPVKYMMYTFYYVRQPYEEGILPRIYCDDELYLYNIPTGKLISWHTGQVDSEILNVRKDTVYYRVYDAIYAAPIIDNEKLGKPKLLIRHKYIPAVHWMYFEGE